MDDALREREYSPSSCIGGDYRPFIDAYARRSAEAFAAARALGGRWQRCRYGSTAAQTLELCAPDDGPAGAAGGRALLLFIHGGYWQELSAQQSLFAAASCIARGHAFAALDYTLAPQATVAQIVGECRAAFGWLLAHAGGLGLDARRIVLAGSSAGAHLAAMVAQAAAAGAPGAGPQAVVLVSGVYWLEPLLGTSINDALSLDAGAARRASPGLLPLRGCAPALLCWGEVETAAFKAQGRDFVAALRAAGTGCEAFEVPGRNHFDVILDLADGETLLGRRTLALLAGGAIEPGSPP